MSAVLLDPVALLGAPVKDLVEEDNELRSSSRGTWESRNERDCGVLWPSSNPKIGFLICDYLFQSGRTIFKAVWVFLNELFRARVLYPGVLKYFIVIF